jgi:membrane protein
MAGVLRSTASLLKETVARWTEDKASSLAAALAYYALFSLTPLVLIAVAVAGLVFGQRAAEGKLYSQLAGLMGESGARAVEHLVASMHQERSGGIVATVVGLATLLFGASKVFGQLQDSMNTIWKAERRTGGGLLGFLRARLISFGMVLGIGFLLLASLVLSTVLDLAGEHLGPMVPVGLAGGQTLDAVLSLVVFSGLFALLYKLVPDTSVAWRDVWPGALVTSLLFAIGKFAFGFYVRKAGVASSYGAAGSAIILLLWIYYSAMILYFGAEFTHVYAMHHGSRRTPP